MISTPTHTAPSASSEAATPARSKDRPSPFFEAARVSSVGVEMAVATGIGWGLGYWIDSSYGTGPWFMLIGLLYGVAAGFKGLIRTAKQVRADQQADEQALASAGLATGSEVS